MFDFRCIYPFSVVFLCLLSFSHANAACNGQMISPVIEMSPGNQRELDIGEKINRLAVADPNLADIQLISEQRFLVTAKQSGVTNLSVWTKCQTQPVQSLLYVRGKATTAMEDAVSIRQPQVGAYPSQVQTDIRFVEVNRTRLKEVGIRLFGTQSNNFLFGSPNTVTGNVPVGEVNDITPGIGVPLLDNGFNIMYGGGSSKFLGALNALENSGYAYTLARPSLVALSGQSASFLAGGEFPVPVPNSSSDSISIEYKEFGVRLALTPTIAGPNRITLKVAPEVSELDFTNGITIETIRVPALTVRRTDTSISLASGESFVISGLISSSSLGTVDKLPGLGDLPILGAFFRSSRIEREERELLMIVTPHLVQPLSADAELPELPGEQLKNYDPSVFELLFYEKGEFKQPSGMSR
ncbi:MAG: type II and III secretion system protein family protein [Gammaproteobacteria bacterium]|nr:MAG: type II and III secretion system protein family protein [Gammaproteobacteria bacterium]